MATLYANQSLGDILIEEGLIRPDELARILGGREDATEPLGDLLVRLGLLSPRDRARCLGRQLRIPFLDLRGREIDTDVANLIPLSMASRLCALPLERSPTALSMVMINPLDVAAIGELQAHTGLEIDPFIAAEEDIREAIIRAFGAYDDLSGLITETLQSLDTNDPTYTDERDAEEKVLSYGDLRKMSKDAPVVRLVNAMVVQAITSRASDIHIEPERERLRVRFRVDGLLQDAMGLPKEVQLPLISRLKIIAGMDIAEQRAPQDGRLTLQTPGGEYDMRLSTYPCLYGENMVIRILDKSADRIHLPNLGMEADTLAELQHLIQRPHGMILACGPTGSGKTTTLYACLNALNSVERNIMTIEDPVEYRVNGIIQGNVNAKAGVTFASGLRTLVRQDPDVILVGEIRDGETARIAVEAALTGHMVLSTIHANNSAGAVNRLIDMGIEPFLVASTLVAAVSQRLLRLNCKECLTPYLPDPELIARMKCEALSASPGWRYLRGAGCETCNGVGFKGRTGVYELMAVTEPLERLIQARVTTRELCDAAFAHSRQLRADAFCKLSRGLTTLEEIARVTVD
ncbi:MAG TPA: GspE/PulE family protein [Chthonomonadaceae bacterium]|nr:GspE/PulE family protein [Chthonomonadaceae bacterium]